VSTAPVIVGTDLSGSAAEAIRQAGAWAARASAPLLVVHVAPDEIFAALETPKVEAGIAKRVEATLAGLDVSAEIAIEAGSPHAALVRLSEERRARLVVVGASGAGAMRRALFGSTAEQVLRHAHSPVLVARPSPETGPVLVATDFSEHAEAAVSAAAAEARARGVPLRLVHSLFDPSASLSMLGPILMTPPEIPEAERAQMRDAAQRTLESLLQATKVDGACEVLTGPPAWTIPEEAKSLGASLVVVATRGRTGLARLALGSVAEAIARHAPCSVLAVRSEQAKQ
jgi:nucleotide-binding universal stress UspA family protein